MKYALRVGQVDHAYNLQWVTGRSSGPHWRDARECALGNAQALHQSFTLQYQDALDSQPLIGRDGQLLLVGSFRLDHRVELGQTLGLDDNALRRIGDAELVLRAWGKWGAEAPCHIYGDFAFAVYDKVAETTWLVADRNNAYAIYYNQDETGLRVGSCLSVMRNYPGVRSELNTAHLADLLCDLSSDPSYTPFVDIQRVPWATVVRFDADGARTSFRYWDFDPEKQIRFAKSEDYVDAARELLDDAVRSYLSVKGPYSGCLTGGLDSASILGTLCRLNAGRDIHAFTAVPSPDTPKSMGALIDEGARARLTVAAWPEVYHQLLEIGCDQHKALVSAPEATFLAGGTPLRNINNTDWLGAVFQQAARQGSTGIFVGDRGNLGLSWHGKTVIAQSWQRGRFDRALKDAWRLVKDDPYGLGFLRTLWQEGIRPNLGKSTRDFCTRTMGYPLWTQLGRATFIQPDVVKEMDLGSRVLQYVEDQYRKSTRSSAEFRVARFHATSNALLPQGAHQLYRYGILPLRPLANTRLLEFCFAIPDEQFFYKGQARWLAKRVLADRMPAASLTPQPRVRQGGNHFARMKFHQAELLQEVERLETSPVIASLLNTKQIKESLQNLPETAAEWHGQKGMDTLLGKHLPRAINMAQYIRWANGSNC